MSCTRALLPKSLATRPSLSATHKAQAHAARPAALIQSRHYAAKGRDKKDDLGGPGGQEPADPEARAQQNASMRNKTMLGMALALGIPLFYMVGRPGRIAERELDTNSSAGTLAGNNPGEKLGEVQGGMPGGRQEQRNQWQGSPEQGAKATR
ncbi:hypothetical protein KVR01_009405 [Diaporthe batatas]|uniref:uncharacterized protein n=1 Tax=Diaporthe batatas TaxID=748121 RepID=UPI001D03A9A8|nr:uncharacterized protein KVR01_009405 [Diaporthe batatas]KAG8161141.1 hypothetical protein KVR01_009405 [Diaporthe batatas]